MQFNLVLIVFVMHFAPSFAALALFLSTYSFVSSLSIFPKPPNYDASLSNSIEERGNSVNVTETNLSCMNPSQINLNANEPGLGSCNWKKWAECTALAVGACLLACEAGGSVSSHLIKPPSSHNTDLLQTNDTFIAAYWTQPAISA